MVGQTSPHAYARGLAARGGSTALLQELRQVDLACLRAGVTPVYTLTHLCSIAKVSHATARDILFNHRAHYKKRKLAKRSGGGHRLIHEPSAPLRALQSTILNECLPGRPASPISFAFENGRNTSRAAEQHIGARAMVHVDVENFYGSITSRRVYSLFTRLGYPELLALEMAMIATVGHESTLRAEEANSGLIYEILKEGYLPQGASTSGKISNLALIGLDEALHSVAVRWGGVITRYADDITFSTPHPLSRKSCSGVLSDLRQVLNAFQLQLNDKKTVLIPRSNEFKMLGLCVGQKGIWLDRRYKRRIQAHLYGVEKYGLENHAISRGFNSDFAFLSFIWGHYAYCAGIEPPFAREIGARLALADIPRL